MLDTLGLSRWQFGITVGVHFAFVTISLGMVWQLFAMELMGWRTGEAAWRSAAKFFGKLFVITFAFGAATGIVMEFQFGTNWGPFSKYVGDIFGPPLAAETMFAFFLESVFIGLYIFGRDRVSKGLHLFSALMVAVGATMSAFWILVANSWMQTPAGYVIENGVVRLHDFTEALFNPSIWPRFFHTVDAVMIGGSFFIAGVAAWMVLKDPKNEPARKALKTGLIFAFIVSVLEVWPLGHWHITQVGQTQPEKFASFEGIEKSGSGIPFVLFGIPRENPSRLVADVRVPNLLSILMWGRDYKLQGLDAFKAEDLPPFAITFASFHLMVYMGLFFIALGLAGYWLIYNRGLYSNKHYLRVLVINIPLPIIACQLGWIAAEVGRQPWLVYKVMRTSAGVSVLQGSMVLGSVIFFIGLYTILACVYVYIITYLIKKGMGGMEGGEAHGS